MESRRNKRRREIARTDLRIIQFIGIPPEVHLYDIAIDLAGRANSIVAVYRGTDCKRRLKSNMIFAYLHNEQQFNEIVLSRELSILGHTVSIKLTNWFSSSIAAPNLRNAPANLMHGYPMNVQISNLRPVNRITTFYVAAILKEFEDQADVVGISLLYNMAKEEVRPFGFVSLADRQSAAQYDGKTISVCGDTIACKLGKTVPLLLSEGNRQLLETCGGNLTEELIRANWLNVEQFDTDGVDREMRMLSIRESESSDVESLISLGVDYEFNEEDVLVKRRR